MRISLVFYENLVKFHIAVQFVNSSTGTFVFRPRHLQILLQKVELIYLIFGEEHIRIVLQFEVSDNSVFDNHELLELCFCIAQQKRIIFSGIIVKSGDSPGQWSLEKLS